MKYYYAFFDNGCDSTGQDNYYSFSFFTKKEDISKRIRQDYNNYINSYVLKLIIKGIISDRDEIEFFVKKGNYGYKRITKKEYIKGIKK